MADHGIPRLHLGSVAEQIVRHAHCSVLVARPTSNRGVVVAATDLSDPSMPAITRGAEEAHRRGARLVVTHAIDFAGGMLSPDAFFLDAVRSDESATVGGRLREAATDALRQALRACGATGDTHIVEGRAAAAIVRCADELGAELLVVGTRGRTGFARLALGSVAERVIRTASCPVLAVRLAH